MTERLSSVCLALATLAAELTSAGQAFGQAASSGAPPPASGSQTPPSDGASGEASASRPVVVSPTLVREVPPVYPEAAFAEGLEAEVRVVITVNEDGTVSNPEVPEPVGHGFDEAAMAAATELRFTPATVDGAPRKVRISYTFRFDVPDEPPAEPEVRPIGDLNVRVLLSGSDAVLPGLQVVLVDELGGSYALTTDATGRASLDGVPAGKYRVQIEAEGYVPMDSLEEVFTGEATDVTYRLTVASTELEVLVEGERPPREVTRRTIQRREIDRIPGTSGDALRSLQSLPGVARPPGLAGLLIVRGSSPQDTATFVDGLNVPLIYHFGGLSSVVPTEMLDKIDFYPGNFSVRYGRVQAGVVDVGLRSPNVDCYGDYGAVTDDKGCFHGLVELDNINGRVMLSGPIAGDWTFAVAGRRSWIETWLAPILESTGTTVTNAPVYYDYQAIVERNRGPDDRLSIRFYGSDDRFESIITEPAATDPGVGGSLRFGTSFVRGQLLYQKKLAERVYLDTQASVGTNMLEFELGPNTLRVNDVPVLFRSELGFVLHPKARLNVGIDYLGGPFDVLVRVPPPPRPGEAAPPPLATAVQRQSQATGTSFRPGWYTDLEWQPTERLRVVPGVRIDYARDTGSPDFSPRVNARYSLFVPEDEVLGGRKTVLKGGVGKYTQPPQFQETDDVFGTPGLESNVAWHYSLGVEQGLTKQVEVSLEGFYKDLESQVSRAPNASGTYLYGNQGTGRVIGLETLVRYNPDERFFGWIAYTLSESLRRDCDSCPERLFEYDQTHNLVILGSYRLGRGWEIGARFRIVSGPLTTPLAGSPLPSGIYAGDAGTYVAVPGQPFSERLPLFHQADIRIDKRWTFRTWRLSTYLDIQNVYNNQAVEGVAYNYDFSQQIHQTGLPILPAWGWRGEF